MSNSSRKKWIKRILFGSTLLMLFLPLIQQKYQFVEVEKLKGSYRQVEAPQFEFSHCLDGSFQQKSEKYLDQALGFRPLFVRIYNQFLFSLFNKPKAYGIVVGKGGFLYEKVYIDSYNGEDFIGRDSLKTKLEKLSEITDSLKMTGTNILTAIAPGKAVYHPEYIPDDLLDKMDTTNYTVFQELMENSGLDFIDYQKWFLALKADSKYPLYPKNGIHWSRYGEQLAIDTLMKKIGEIKDMKVPLVKMDSVVTSTIMQGRDEDIEEGMNLLWDIEDLEMAYSSIVFHKDSLTIRPSVLVVADSYFWGMYNRGIVQNAFDKGQFWYYNKQIYPGYGKDLFVENINILEEVKQFDIVVLMATDANLHRFAYGFIEQVHEALNRKEAVQ